MITDKKTKYLVVDTAGFIAKAPLQDIAEEVYSTPSVVQEIKSKSQLRNLAVLPYDLKLKEPFPEDIKNVTDFAKKTGDYASLSATDIQIIALTYRLEKEHVGVDHLRTEPIRKSITPKALPCEDFKEIAGFYCPKEEELENSSSDCLTKENSEDVTLHLEHLSVDDEGSANLEDAVNESKGDNTEGWYDCEEGEEEEMTDDDDDDDDNDGWITPSNIQQLKGKIISEVDEEEKPLVACMTTDFAIQNVLKQMGLHLVALDGRVIKEVRTFILRCYGCFKTTSIMGKVFCPNCGNKTLRKVAVTTNIDGSQQIHINFRRPLTARGKRFSLPTPKGGKYSNNPILYEDQPLPQQRTSRLSRTKNNPLDDDYIAGFSPFVTRDVNSRSAMLGIRQHAQVKQCMRKNPNESNKPGGRKRK